VVVAPGSANPIAGQICAFKTAGRCLDQMVVTEPLAIKFAMGENPKMTYGSKNQTPYTRMAVAAIIREQLQKARRYSLARHVAEADPSESEPEYDARCEALIPLLRRTISAHFHAHKAYDILTAIRIAEEFDLDYTIIHCTEGHLIADILAEKGAKAVCGPLISARTKPELAGLSAQNCATLLNAGVTVGICTDHPEIPSDFLASSAALSVRGGLSEEQALAAITIDAARAVNLEQRLGSITPGKDADLLVYSDDPLGLYTKPDEVYIEGNVVEKNCR
jgi:imidazolonepropionase-like amidohydrolase